MLLHARVEHVEVVLLQPLQVALRGHLIQPPLSVSPRNTPHYEERTTHRSEEERHHVDRVDLAPGVLQIPPSGDELVHTPRPHVPTPVSQPCRLAALPQDVLLDDTALPAYVGGEVELPLGGDEEGEGAQEGDGGEQVGEVGEGVGNV